MALDLHDSHAKITSCCVVFRWEPEGRAGLVRLLEFYGYGMETLLLSKSPMVDVC